MVGIAFAISAAGTVNAELFEDYVSYKACMQYHTDKVEGWKTTPHANAFEEAFECFETVPLACYPAHICLRHAAPEAFSNRHIPC